MCSGVEVDLQTYVSLLFNYCDQSSCLYRASMTIKTLYYPTGAQTYNS